MRRFVAAAVVVVALLLPVAAHAGSTVPLFPDHPPVGFERTALQVERIAERTSTVRRERRQWGRLDPVVVYDSQGRRWEAYFWADGDVRAQVLVDDFSGRVLGAWTGIQAKWEMARPAPGKFGHRLNAPYIWLPLCALFLLPFIDPRRPFRMLHLDLLALLAFGASHILFNRGEITASMPVAYPVLAYLLVRMLIVGFRPRQREGPLVPLLSWRVLAVALVFLVGFRATLNIVDSGVTDVGYAGVIGADRIMRGDSLYDGRFPEENGRGDTYGPAMYLAYVPFTAGFGWSGNWDKLPAAHAAAIAFDLLTIVALLLLGRTVRAGPEGRLLGIALAFAWAANPYTAYVLQSNTNDALISALLALALAALASPPARWALVALAAAAKLLPALLFPLFATAHGERGARPLLLACAGAVAVLLVVVAPFLAQVGPDQVYDRTLGYQFDRISPFSIWGLEPSLEWVQRVVQAATIGLALLVAFMPRRKSFVQIAALGAAVIIAFEIGVTHWFYLYIVWFLPFVFVALFATHRQAFAVTPRTR